MELYQMWKGETLIKTEHSLATSQQEVFKLFFFWTDPALGYFVQAAQEDTRPEQPKGHVAPFIFSLADRSLTMEPLLGPGHLWNTELELHLEPDFNLSLVLSNGHGICQQSLRPVRMWAPACYKAWGGQGMKVN